MKSEMTPSYRLFSNRLNSTGVIWSLPESRSYECTNTFCTLSNRSL